MNRFAELLDRLAYEPGRNNKLRLLTAYFRETEDPDRGYALAALTGALSFKHAKPGLIRDLIADRTDPVLFALSYDYVGDLSETVALMWPSSPLLPLSPPQPLGGGGRSGGEGSGVGGLSTHATASEFAEAPPTPDLESELRSPQTPPLRGGRGEEVQTARLRAFVFGISATATRLPGPGCTWTPLAVTGSPHSEQTSTGSNILPQPLCSWSRGLPRSSTMWVSPQCTIDRMIG